MTILVTGGTGLVGERLLPRLAQAGLGCRALIRAGKSAPAGSMAVEGDILEPQTLERAMQGVEAVIHLAALFRTADTEMVWRVNLEGTRNLIAAARAHAPQARFIMASTTNVYDTDISHPGRENDLINPQQAYPASKLAAEKELQASGLNWSIQRFGFVYGESDRHLEDLPGRVQQAGWHPAKCISLIHHRDIATAMHLALSGALDGQIINLVYLISGRRPSRPQRGLDHEDRRSL